MLNTSSRWAVCRSNVRWGLRAAGGSLALLALVGCATTRRRLPDDVANDVLTRTPVSSVALLGAVHVSNSVSQLADSLLVQRLRATCPSARILSAGETEELLAARRVVPPRRLSAEFARDARAALEVDLLLAPMALGLTYDRRATVAGALDAIARPQEPAFTEQAGLALEGWDLRSYERTVSVVRLHDAQNSWTGNPIVLLRNAVGDAARTLAPLCGQGATADSARR